MNEKTAILNVRMLGDFSITYDGRQVSFGKNTTTKAMKLLQILIYYGEQGIAREKLLNALYVREELADAANNLRVTAMILIPVRILPYRPHRRTAHGMLRHRCWFHRRTGS